jgi:hypothetical protein
VQQHVDLRGLPVEALLLVADVLDRVAGVFSIGARLGRRPSCSSSADFAGDAQEVGGHQGLAGDARLRVEPRKASTTASEMRSHTLSGWPSETDSLV